MASSLAGKIARIASVAIAALVLIASGAARAATSDAPQNASTQAPLAAASAASASNVSDQPSFALYYGADPPVEMLSAYDAAVVEPDSGFDPRAHRLPHTTWFAYTSVGEVLPSRPYYAALPKAWLAGHNEAWASRVVDQSQPGWPAFFVDHVIAPLWARGYRGFFLDTLDSYHLVAGTANNADEARKQQEAGLVAVIRAIKARYPDAKLIFNRGFEILPQVHDLVYAVAFESLFHGWDQAQQRYTEVPAADRDWLLAQARTIRDQYHLPAISIDYCAPADQQCARDSIDKIRALGIVPYVTDGGLQTMGVGLAQPVKRRILLVQDPPPRTSLNTSAGLRYLAMPLNYLGYTIDYQDVRDPLPQGDLSKRYAGIVLWLNNEVPRQNEYRRWLEAQVDAGIPLAVFTSFGIQIDAQLAHKLALQTVDGAPAGRLAVESYDAKLMGFEMKPQPDPHDYTPVRAGPGSRSLLRLRAGSFEIDGAALTPWGGYAMRPFGVFDLGAVNQARWVLQPIAFLRAALRLPSDMPVPDTTTENGRRLAMSHIDGDGFASRAEFRDSAQPNTDAQPEFSGDVLYRVLRDTGMPTTVSLIEGEVTDDGPYRKIAPRLREIGRQIFALPNVEVATHTYTHPLQWMRITGLGDPDSKDVTTEGGGAANTSGLSIDIPGYRFSIDREVGGSIRYLDTHVAPTTKPVKMVLWSGDCQVPAPVLKAAYQAGVLNMNGGDTVITKSYPSWTAIAPLGVRKDGYYQVFAPNQNEELYTDLWHGPYYGFSRLLETLDMTDKPIRFKPIDVYYHMFTGTKYAGVHALQQVLDAVLKQSVTPVFTSDYAQSVLDWEDTSIARDGAFWVVRNGGDLRTVRLPTGKAPDLSNAQGVAGYLAGPGGTYVHLTGSAARFTVIDAARAPHVPHLADANGRLEHFARDANGFSFDLRALVAPQFRLADAGACRVSRRTLSGYPYGLHVDVSCAS
ncbi:bifunctional glycoside hydrolase 114/ polysaccharide deacetylase family protein [Paraburkholderia jirisanensis]